MLPHLTTTETMEELKFLGGIRLRILLPTAATNGTVAVFEDIVEPGIGPGRHIHHGEDETFFVMEGQFAFEADGKRMEAGTGDIVEAVRHMRAVSSAIKELQGLDERQLAARAVEYRVPTELVRWVAESQMLPVPNFSAGGVATPADAALMMQLGAQSVFVGSGIFKSDEPVARGKAIVRAVTEFDNPASLVEVSRGLGKPMSGREASKLAPEEQLAQRGW